MVGGDFSLNGGTTSGIKDFTSNYGLDRREGVSCLGSSAKSSGDGSEHLFGIFSEVEDDFESSDFILFFFIYLFIQSVSQSFDFRSGQKEKDEVGEMTERIIVASSTERIASKYI